MKLIIIHKIPDITSSNQKLCACLLPYDMFSVMPNYRDRILYCCWLLPFKKVANSTIVHIKYTIFLICSIVFKGLCFRIFSVCNDQIVRFLVRIFGLSSFECFTLYLSYNPQVASYDKKIMLRRTLGHPIRRMFVVTAKSHNLQSYR
jgi:hypothetical protein